MKHTFLLICFFLFGGHCCVFAQTNEVIARPSADVWEFLKYGNTPVNLYTGTISVTVPLYHYKDKDFDIPLSLTYASNGWCPNRLQGSLSQGWHMNAGGCITRQIRDNPDEKHSLGKLKYVDYSRVSEEGELPNVFSVVDKGTLVAYALEYPMDSKAYYDTQPDIFTFNFLGYSGNFQLGPGNKIHVYNTNFPSGEIQIDYAPFPDYGIMDAFSIKMGDGYVYYFGEVQDFSDDANGKEYTKAFTFEGEGDATTTSWYLTRVVAPNGREVEFRYLEAPFQLDPYLNPHTEMYAYSDWMNNINWEPHYTHQGSNDQGWVFERVRIFPVRLHEIRIDNRISVRYVYNQHKEDYSVASMSVTDLQSGRLLKSCEFSYLYKHENILRFLQTVKISGEGTYNFDYYAQDSLIPYQSFYIDHWGYYRGKSNYSSFIPKLENDGFFGEKIVGKSRDPEPSYARWGMLKTVTYPTGGYTRFSYEGHDYSRSIRRTSTSSFYPYLKSEATDQLAGGLRISKIEDHPITGEAVSREFIYKDNNNRSSGILLKYPRYKISYQSVSASSDMHFCVRSRTLYSSLHNSVYSLDEGHMSYGVVTEKRNDNSRIEYHYSDYASNPDDSTMLLLMRVPAYMVEPYIHLPLMNYYCRFYSNHRDRGKLLEKIVYNSSGELMSRERNVYDTSPLPYIYGVYLRGDVYGLERIYVKDHLLLSTVKTEYLSGNSIQSYVNYSYNALGQLQQITTQDSRGVTYAERRQYVNDLFSSDREPIEDTMVSRNMICTPLYIEKSYRTSGGEEKFFSGERVLYSLIHNQVLPYSLQRMRPAIPFSTPSFEALNYTDTELTYDRYDTGGRVLQSQDRSGLKTVYIWGYGGYCLVARIDNVSFTDVMQIKGLGNLENAPLEEGLSLEQNSYLRHIPGALVTTYDYIPFVGLSCVMDAAGIETHYEYDSDGRLIRITDHKGQLTEAYEYHVKQ
ncbi:hypothetical protein CE91St19_25900 [Odoribacter laneus]|jgi:hypothetical protein|uniref:RHS repeat protein n=1 Tax=Odoribacter laneus TaxID=626933 RepID=UPI0018988C99|nr:RHS repeat protein [Odoribacter laneus]GKI23188.1 hypothetical protein CE91St19_25900 [Odoribacter laneus]GKI25288.1 hypothetical protein CE91St20_14250 [Odoribacter laneus]